MSETSRSDSRDVSLETSATALAQANEEGEEDDNNYSTQDQVHGNDDSKADNERMLCNWRRCLSERRLRITGETLMTSGSFGANQHPNRWDLTYSLMRREIGPGCYSGQRLSNKPITQGLIPSSNADMIILHDSRCFIGEFSDDGSLFFSGTQDSKVHMFDTSNPYSWNYHKTVVFPFGIWVVTDAALSPGNRFVAYSSMRSTIFLASTDPDDRREPQQLDLTDFDSRLRSHLQPQWPTWSLCFSGDGREVMAGTGDQSVYICDIERQRPVLRLVGHSNDVYSVCYGDSNSPHIIYSGSNDTTVRIWDRRSGQTVGVFLGHTGAVRNVDSKRDGRYVLSSGMESMAKLWDVRMMTTMSIFDMIGGTHYTRSHSLRNGYRNPYDSSFVTFYGHSPRQMLDRCYFSPPGSTDSRYVYSTSTSGFVHIWNIDATLAGTIDVSEATRGLRPYRRLDLTTQRRRTDCSDSRTWGASVRDASWHPYLPVIAVTSTKRWGAGFGTACSVHVWDQGVHADEGEDVNSHPEHNPEYNNVHDVTRRRLTIG